MLETDIIEGVYARLKGDTVLQNLMVNQSGSTDFEFFMTFGRRTPQFPYMVHSVKLHTATNCHVMTGKYNLDIYFYGLDRTALTAAVHRVKVLLHRFLLPGKGGARLFIRDVAWDTQKEWVQRAMLLFAVRGVDVEFTEDSL